jgi:1-deoxy-D-xylulose-5-phosphate synthase
VSELLTTINTPVDLRALAPEQLPALAEEVRECLIATVSQTGGHLAASLGAVELTLAVHYVLHTPKDKIVWDVGHQAYAHKLITGRREQFCTLRQAGGISGFPRRDESEYDTFDTGHGSTAIAAAVGMAKARDIAGEDHTVAAIVGDGAMTGGMAFEALNLAGHLKTPLIVLLNDNEMSIARNVGALSGYLSNVRLDPHYSKAKQDFESLVSRLPLGESLIHAVDRFKDGVKHLLIPGMLFEELGFTYLGPIDGHSLPVLLDTLVHARELKRPVLIHCITQKGRGYQPAENDAAKWHRTGAFDIETGEPVSVSSGHSFTKVFGQQLVELGAQDARIVAITAAMREGTGLSAFAEKFPNRFFDVGMAEQTAVTFGAGLAAEGMRPVVAIYSTFLQRSYDQIIHDVALPRLPVTLALDRAGIVGEDGATHHGAFDLSFLRHIPGLVVMAPSDLTELAAMLQTARMLDGPCAIRYPRGEGLNPPQGEVAPLPVGKAHLVKKGEGVALLVLGTLLAPALAAAQALESKGIHAAVVNARFAKPLDEELICEIVRTCGRIVTVEENTVEGGFGSSVEELLQQHHLQVPVLTLGLPKQFVQHGTRAELLARCGLDEAGIARTVERFVNEQVRV